jgi:solute carrier family 12 (sodium/potassium/chloride transporter), member 2
VPTVVPEGKLTTTAARRNVDDQDPGQPEADDTRRYGTIEGVFVPTLLTILGVILFLRTGWVVGNAGLLGAVGIIALAFAITGATAVSLASISTNVTPGAGGAYALVARSFGVEAGGAVGVSLYLSQSLVIVLYLFGFRDGWLAIFPDHPAAVIDLIGLLVLIAVTSVGARAAFRVQYLILAVVAVALGAVAVAAFTEPLDRTPELIGTFPGSPEEGFVGVDIWVVFAVFFPATTGIMAGLNMSGELIDARRSILRGTLSAVGVSLVIYLSVAVWLAFAVPVDELVGDYFALAERSAWAPGVLAGLLAATFSSALASLVGAPRILHALAEDNITPASGWLSRRSGTGEPRHALMVTIAVVVAGVLLRDLNAVAEVITMVFLLTYGAINASVLAETAVDLPSYRPTFRVAWPIPLVGVIGCFGAMVVINPLATAIALLAVVGVLIWVIRRDVVRPVADIRSAILVAVARWATRTARSMVTSDERTWSPRFLVPLTASSEVDRARSWLPELAEHGDPVRLVPMGADGGGPELFEATRALCAELGEVGVEASCPDAGVDAGGRGPAAALVAAGDGDDPSSTNVVVAAFPERREEDRMTRMLLRDAFEADAGVVLVPGVIPGSSEDEEPVVALWLREQGPTWHLDDHLPHADLALLVAYRLTEAWGGSMTLVTALGRETDPEQAEEYLGGVAERARLPAPEIHLIDRPFASAIEGAPAGVALHVFALSSQTDLEWLREVQGRLDAPCLFVRDSGVENAFA